MFAYKRQRCNNYHFFFQLYYLNVHLQFKEEW